MVRGLQALLFYCVLSHSLGAAVTQVRLGKATNPTSGQPGVGYITVTGVGFPAGTISIGNVGVTLTPPSGPASKTHPVKVKVVSGTTETVTFVIPPAITVSAPAVYAVTIAGSTSTGAFFQSANSASLTVNPAAQLLSIAPMSGVAGSSLSVLITGSFTNFVQGTTTASFGAGISVGGGAAGQAGIVTVSSATSATAQISINPTAAPGTQTVSVATGTEQESLINGFTVTPAPQLLSVTPSTLNAGLAATVTLTGSNTHFVQGQTLAAFGPGVTVGGGTEGQPGPVTVTSATTATAQIAVDPAATAGSQTVTVATGTETESLTSGFTIGALVGVINISTASTMPLAPGFVGAHDEFDLNGVEYYDPKYLAMVEPLKFGSIRFPGGLPTMAYDWQTGKENQTWFKEIEPKISTFAIEGITLATYLLQAKGGANFSDFATFINTLGATGIVDVNGFTDNLPNSYGLLTTNAVTNNVNIADWEICNEPYGYPKLFPTATAYAAQAQNPYVDNILAADPAATTSVFYEGQYSGFGDGTAWDNAMNAFSPHYWQAVSTHIYPINNFTLSTTAEEQQLNGFLAHATNDYFNNYFIPKIGANTPIYITEWNTDGIGSLAFESYIYNAVVLTEFLARVATVPNIKEVGITEIYLGNDFNQGMIRAVNDFESYLIGQVQANPHYSTNTATNPNTQFSFYYSTDGLALLVADPAINSSNSTWPTTVSSTGIPTVPITGFDGLPVPAVFAQAFQGTDGTHYLLIFNKSGTSVPVGIEVNGLLGPSSVTASYISSPSDTAQNTATNQNAVSIVNTTFQNPLTVGPYSVTRVQW